MRGCGLTRGVGCCQFVAGGCAGDDTLVDMLVSCLLGWMVDPSRLVRRLCVRGLGNVASLGDLQVSLSAGEKAFSEKIMENKFL